MILRDAVFGCRILSRSLNGPNSTLPGDPALQLGTHFIGGAFLDRIGATSGEHGHRQQ